MKHSYLPLVVMMVLVAMVSPLIFGQGGASSSLSGVVVDQTGALIPGADVVLKNKATGAEFKAVTADNGTFSVPALDPGTYTVTVGMVGFKQAVTNDVAVTASVPASVRVTLEIGSTSETIVVQGGGSIIQSQSANIATTLSVNQIMNLPLVSRNALDFVVAMTGTNTPRGGRDSTVNGLPQSAINITIDGVNVQDNYLKTGDGMFARISPRLDAVEEVTVSTATPGAESGGHGAVQIKFTTRQGNNQLHGSLYEYHRNPWLNSNYWYNNRDLPPDPKTGKAPRDRVLLNQFGGRVGGPISIPKLFSGKDRAYFFFNYEAFRLPSQLTRQRTVLNPLTQGGLFQYNVTVSGQTQVRSVDLFALAASKGFTSTPDPVISKLLADIRSATGKTGAIQQLTDPNLQRYTFTNNSMAVRHFPTSRFDFNLTEKHHLEVGYNYQKFDSNPDLLNSRDPAFPGFPNQGSQLSNRFQGSIALRSTLSSRLVNEFRTGLTGGSTLFNPQASPGQFTGPVADQAGFNLGISAAGITNPSVISTPSRRNAPTKLFEDTLSWTKGTHSLSFGGSFTQVNLWLLNQRIVPSIAFSVNANDPAISMFVPANFQGAASADVTRAQNIYAVLTGRVTTITADANLDEETGQYAYNGSRIQRGRIREWGFFVQDSWRMRPGLNLSYGLRWELQMPFVALNDSYSTATAADVWGVSGEGNLFKPGVQTGRQTQFTQLKSGARAFKPDYKNFAPSFGFAWSPTPKYGWLKRLMGESGQSVIRGGYSIAYNRNGMSDYSDILGSNPGVALTVNRSTTIGNLVTGTGGDVLPVLLRDTSRLGPPAFPKAPVYPITGAITDSVNVFDPKLTVPYAQSWTFGIQREMAKNMALEVRYVGTRNLRGWTTYDFNETNIVENGFLNEFKLAMANLQANIAAGRGNTFKYFGVNTNTSPLPTILAYFSGVPAAQAGDASRYTSTQFTNSTWINRMAPTNPSPYGMADDLYNDANRRAFALSAGLPANFFLVNPHLLGGANITSNGGYTRYDGLQVELRRRLSQGLMGQVSYVFAKGFSSSRYSLRAPRVNTFGSTLQHVFKANWVYELPIGRGRTLFTNASPWMDRLVGGWEFHGVARVQSGEILNFGSVRVVGMTRKDFVKQYKLRFDDANKLVYMLPQDIIDNTIKAFSVQATSATGYGSLGPPTGRYLAPANSAGCINVFTGQCAPHNLYVNGPMFTRVDMSAVKKVNITEQVSFELRGEFLNAFNNINFFGVTGASNSPTLGQVTSAYRDTSNTQDPGGRLIQIVARISF